MATSLHIEASWHIFGFRSFISSLSSPWILWEYHGPDHVNNNKVWETMEPKKIHILSISKRQFKFLGHTMWKFDTQKIECKRVRGMQRAIYLTSLSEWMTEQCLWNIAKSKGNGGEPWATMNWMDTAHSVAKRQPVSYYENILFYWIQFRLCYSLPETAKGVEEMWPVLLKETWYLRPHIDSRNRDTSPGYVAFAWSYKMVVDSLK